MRIKFCPKCNSTDLVMLLGGSVGMWKCKKCNFQSSIFPEKELNRKSKGKKIRRKKKK